MSKPLWVVTVACALGCATGREIGPNPAFAEAPESSSVLGAAWEQHWIETLDQLNTGELHDPAPEVASNWALRLVRLPFAVSADAVTLVGLGAAGLLAVVPVHMVEDVRPSSCRAPGVGGVAVATPPDRG